MKPSDASHLSDSALRVALRELVTLDRRTTARMLVYLAEFDGRRLFAQDGHPSMYAFCVAELGMSEDAAYKRIRAARAAGRFPRIFGAIADGTLTLSAVVMLAPHLIEATADDLLASAAGKTKEQIEQILALRFPMPDLPTLVQPITSAPTRASPSSASTPAAETECQELAPGPVEARVNPVLRPRVRPLAPERYGVQFTIAREDHELLQQAKNMLGHVVPSGDEGEIFVRALRVLVR